VIVPSAPTVSEVVRFKALAVEQRGVGGTEADDGARTRDLGLGSSHLQGFCRVPGALRLSDVLSDPLRIAQLGTRLGTPFAVTTPMSGLSHVVAFAA
jgi:hypothetical protein